MPLPPHLQNALSYTDSGIPYATLWAPGYSERNAADAGQTIIQVLVAFEDKEDFKADVLGYASWAGGQIATLTRKLPLQCPANTDLWCDEVKFIKWGMIADGAKVMADPFQDNWPVSDWVQYSLSFTRPHYFVRSDTTMQSSPYNQHEQFRFAEISRRAVPREQRQPSMYFEVQVTGGAWQPVETPAFVPVCDTEILIKLIEWPVSAFPEKICSANAGTVNYSYFPTGDGNGYVAGELLFKGVQQPLSWFPNAAGDFVVSPVLTLTRKAGGWNKQLLPDLLAGSPPTRRYGSVRNKKAPHDPPYASTEFQLLVTPIAPS